MLGSHLKYQQSRKDARDKIESEDVSTQSRFLPSPTKTKTFHLFTESFPYRASKRRMRKLKLFNISIRHSSIVM
jgi:hypothetical protein